jgi:hypothetical protein
MTSLIEGCPLLTLFSARHCRSITHATLYLLGTPSASLVLRVRRLRRHAGSLSPIDRSGRRCSDLSTVIVAGCTKIALEGVINLTRMSKRLQVPLDSSSFRLFFARARRTHWVALLYRFSMRPRWATTTPPSAITTSNPTGAYHRSAAVLYSWFRLLTFGLLRQSLQPVAELGQLRSLQGHHQWIPSRYHQAAVLFTKHMRLIS